MGQGLDVVDEGPPFGDPRFVGRGCEPGPGLAAVDPGDQGGLLPGHVTAGGEHHLHSQPGRAGWTLGQGGTDNPGGGRLRSLNRDDGPFRPDGGGRGRHAIEDQMRVVRQEDAVFGRQRFAFGAVGHEHRRAAALGHGGQLASGRETGAPPTAQPGRGHLVDEAAIHLGRGSEPAEMVPI